MNPLGVLTLIFGGLIVVEPDLGTTITLCGMMLAIFLVAGVPVRLLVGASTLAVGLGLLAIWIEPYRRARVFSFLDPWSDAQGAGFQIVQATIGSLEVPAQVWAREWEDRTFPKRTRHDSPSSGRSRLVGSVRHRCVRHLAVVRFRISLLSRSLQEAACGRPDGPHSVRPRSTSQPCSDRPLTKFLPVRLLSAARPRRPPSQA
jgi:hypothetical protein